jgi:hypothetical protein
VGVMIRDNRYDGNAHDVEIWDAARDVTVDG